jgi:hypothetical protein
MTEKALGLFPRTEAQHLAFGSASDGGLYLRTFLTPEEDEQEGEVKAVRVGWRQLRPGFPPMSRPALQPADESLEAGAIEVDHEVRSLHAFATQRFDVALDDPSALIENGSDVALDSGRVDLNPVVHPEDRVEVHDGQTEGRTEPPGEPALPGTADADNEDPLHVQFLASDQRRTAVDRARKARRTVRRSGTRKRPDRRLGVLLLHNRIPAITP